MAKRTKIPKKLENEVLFASDNTCCVCRDRSKGVQIHHIDSNPSNNTFDNLAVLCLEHHDMSTTPAGLSRGFPPEQVKLYNDSWRDIVKTYLITDVSSHEYSEYRQEVFLEISLTCHSWKNEYMDIYPSHFQGDGEGGHGDIWDHMIDTGTHKYSQSEWKKYLPLFDSAIKHVVQEIDGLASLHKEVLPLNLKTLFIRTKRSLTIQSRVYLIFPMIAGLSEDNDSFFTQRFIEVIRTLSQLSRESDRLRNEILAATQ